MVGFKKVKLNIKYFYKYKLYLKVIFIESLLLKIFLKLFIYSYKEDFIECFNKNTN